MECYHDLYNRMVDSGGVKAPGRHEDQVESGYTSVFYTVKGSDVQVHQYLKGETYTKAKAAVQRNTQSKH